MIKKVFVCLISVILILHNTAFATEAESFVFSNGLTWDMNKADIIALEGAPLAEEELSSVVELLYYEGDIGLFGLFLLEDSLFMSAYILQVNTIDDLDIIIQDFTIKYGNAELDSGKQDYISAMSLTDPTIEKIATHTDDSFYTKWILPDNTRILMLKPDFLESSPEDESYSYVVYIYYVSPSIFSIPE